MVKKICIALFSLSSFLHAQTPPTAQEVLDQLKTDARFEDGQADWVQFSELLISFSKDPVSLNSASFEELEAIPLLNKFNVFHLLEYRKQSGTILSYYELNSIEGFDEQLILWLMPFTTLETRSQNISMKEVFINGRHQAAFRFQRLMQEKAGQQNAAFNGDANALYARYRLSYHNKIFAGFTLQKDAGESLIIPGKVYPDYSSFHIEVRNLGVVSNLIIGDYYANYGQGLVLWTTNTFNKTAETVSAQRFGKGLRYYSGADENRFLRGAATSLRFNKLTFDFFASSNKVDATIKNGEATSLIESGLHRTNNEFNKRKLQRIDLAGTHIGFLQNNFEIGLTSYAYKFSIPIAQNTNPYAAHQFYGDHNMATSLDFQWIVHKSIIYAEVAMSKNGSPASITGIKLTPNDKLTVNIHHRYLDKSYQTLYSAPFSESRSSGESGIYAGFQYSFNSIFRLNGYADFYKYSWLRFNTSSPSNGKDLMLQLNYAKKGLKAYLRYRRKTGLEDLRSDQLEIPNHVEQNLVRAHAQLRLNPNIKSNTRFEFRSFDAAEQNLGFMFYQELVSPIKNSGLTVHFRVAYFNIEDYRASIYAREDDLPFTYNLAQFNNEGIKHYLMLQYRYKYINLYLKWSHTVFHEMESIGSGVDEIKGNQRSELKAMVSLKL